MGITSVRLSLEQTKQMIIRDNTFDNFTMKSSVLNTYSYGRQFWILRKIVKNNAEFLTCDVYLMSHKDGETSFKDINIECNPYYYNVPKNWLLVCSDVPKEYMEMYSKFHNKKDIVIGTEFEYNKMKWTIAYKYSSHSWAVRNEQGNIFRMKATTIQANL